MKENITSPAKTRFWLGLLGVLIVAGIMRFAYPTVIEFKHDEATLSILAQDFADGGDFPLVGIPSSVGVPNPPVSVWLLAIPYKLINDPLFATWFVAALNVAGVGLLYLLAYRTIGFWPAVVAGLFYAVNPWAVLYSRKIWAQDTHTPFIILALYLGLLGFYEGKRWARILGLPLLILALQIHFAAWTLLPLWVYLFFTQKRLNIERGGRTQNIVLAGASIALAILVLVPFGVGIVYTLADDPNRLSSAVGRAGELKLSSEAISNLFAFLTGGGTVNEVAPRLFPMNFDFWLLLIPVLPIMALVGSVRLWRRNWRIAGLVSLWILLPLVVFTPTWTGIFPHYFIPLIPAFCLLIGSVTLSFAPDRQPRYLRLYRAVVLVGVGFIVTIQVLYWFRIIQYAELNRTGKFGTPLSYLLPIRDAVRDYDDVVVLTDGIDIRYDQEPAIWTALLDDSATCIRALSGEGRVLLPAHPFAVLLAPNAPEKPVGGLYFDGTLSYFDLRPPDEGGYSLYKHAEAPVPLGPEPTHLAEAVTFNNGAQLTGYTLDAEAGVVVLEWQLPGAIKENFQYFAHFLDEKGEKIGQRDGDFWPGRYWCAGDTLRTIGVFELPDDRLIATLRVGMYRLTQAGNFLNAIVPATGLTWADIAVDDAD